MQSPQDRVRQLIDKGGLGQGGFAAAIGLDSAKMSKSLSGTRRFSSLEFAQIAEHGRVSVDWLLTGHEAPVAMAARKTAGTPTGNAIEVANLFVELRETAHELGYPQPATPIKADDLGDSATAQGRHLASRALEVCRDTNVSSVSGNLADAIEAAFGVDVAVQELGIGFDGLAATTKQASTIVVSPSMLPGRQRFTLAHELGHVLGGDNQGVHSDPDISQAQVTKDPTEMRANAFAASFLMPEEHLRGVVTRGFTEQQFSQLAVDLLVSPIALAYRLETLKLIDSLAADKWKRTSLKEAAQRAERAQDLAAATVQSSTLRPPSLLARDLFNAYLAGKTTLRPYARLMGRSTDEVREGFAADEAGA